MKFSVFATRAGKLKKVLKIHRNKNGLYLIGTGIGGNHISYHEDGRFWTVSPFGRVVKKLRTPLSQFSGTESIAQAYLFDWIPNTADPETYDTKLQPNDILLSRKVPFGLELILSQYKIDLPPHPERERNEVHVKEDTKPLLIIEAFDMSDRRLVFERFPSRIVWKEGENLFFDHTGRI